jgi:hypothetical protein
MNSSQTGPVFAAWCLALLAALLAAGCTKPAAENGDQDTVTLLNFQEQEAGVQPYPLRILVNKRYLRFDDGFAASDFMLMERDTQTIYSVSHEDRSILVVSGYPAVDALPAGIELGEARDADTSAPEIAGKQPVYIRFLANGTVCYHAIVVPGLLQQASAALAEYATVLGHRQFSDMASVPAEMLTPCFLTRHVYAPARHLLAGLPIDEWDDTGYRRTLVDFQENAAVDTGLFELPKGYERFQPGE